MIDIWKRDCPCCGEPAKALFTVNIGSKTIEICISCMKELHRILGDVIREEDDGIEVKEDDE